MKQWMVVFEYNNEVKEEVFSGERYSDVYIEVLTQYPRSKIISISEMSS